MLLAGAISLILPLSDSPVEERKADEKWRLVYGFNLVVHAASYVFIYISLEHPSLKELINGG